MLSIRTLSDRRFAQLPNRLRTGVIQHIIGIIDDALNYQLNPHDGSNW